MVSPGGISPARAVVCRPNDEDLSLPPQEAKSASWGPRSLGTPNSAKGPVSRILSCAVIPLGAALPRTLISDLPGGSGNCSEPPGRAGPARSEAWLFGLRFPPYLVLLRVGFTLPPALPPERCALTAPFHPYPGGTGRPGEPVEPFRKPSRKRGSRGGIFSVALAVHGF